MQNAKIIIIVAYSKATRAIGNKGKIPWYSKEDFKLFKKNTLNNIVIFGRKTWEALPNKPLVDRINIIITRDKDLIEESDGVKVFPSLKEAIEFCKQNYDKDIFLCGGAGIYEEGIELADELHLSEMRKTYEGDVFFPEIDLEKYTLKEVKEYEDFSFKKYSKKMIKPCRIILPQ